MNDSPMTQEVLDLVRLYRAQLARQRVLKGLHGPLHESTRRQALCASLTARELYEVHDVDADEMIEELKAQEA